jgi:hypothetical protein
MRFSLAWAHIAAQNVTLKAASALLGIVVLAQLVALANLAARAPVVIERSCLTRTLAAASPQHSADEIIAFLRDALPDRFDTGAIPRGDFFSIEELGSREKEQSTLQEKQMAQKFLFENASVSEKEILVTGDRLISVGKIKSVLPLALRISLKQVPRNESNPYGLVVGAISQVDDRKDDKK